MIYFNLKNITKLNKSKLLSGITLLLLNIGSKYLILDISKSSQALLKLKIIRRLTLFSIFFVGTRDIILSFLLTSAFIIFSNGLFNEKSKYCILPKNIKENKVSEQEYNEAIKTIKEYKNNDNNDEKNNDSNGEKNNDKYVDNKNKINNLS
tara:strand:+ start:40 stop:492 length:453 start_codon:yes stop_codon:yes gene_type:complete